MEHGWGHQREINWIVRLKVRNGLEGLGRLRDISISGAWITSRYRQGSCPMWKSDSR